MGNKTRLSGNEAVAFAMKQVNPDVMGAFPITPSTEIPQNFSKYIADGLVDTEFIAVESEHSAMSTCIGASAAGARAITATSSAGLAYMNELLPVAASSRLPIVMAVVNRALTGPININNDHSDSMGERDTGWMQIYAESNQEVYDNYIQAFPIAEKLRLPLMVCQDGFITSHALANMETNDDQIVKDFVGEFEPEHWLLNPDEVLAVGPYGVSPYYMEMKKAQSEAMKSAAAVIKEVGKAYGDATGRYYDMVEAYEMEDAEYVTVCIGSSAGTGKAAVNELRAKGVKAGLIKIRVFRPFPFEELKTLLAGKKAVAIMDKADAYTGWGGPIFSESRSALYDMEDKPKMVNYIYGLGGRDVTVETFYQIYSELEEVAKADGEYEVYKYIGVREE